MNQFLIAPFLPFNRLNRVLLGVCLLINGVVLTNAILHDPNFGPDATHHLTYVATLAKLHLPTQLESAEYYSPPLPYLFPFVSIMVGYLLQRVHQVSPVAYTVILGLFGAVFIHNLPAMITRYLP